MRAEVVTVDAAGALGRVELRAEDGAREVVSAHIPRLDVDCLANLDGTDWSCVPRTLALPAPNVFADADCTSPAAYVRCENRDRVILGPSENGCDQRYFERGERLQTAYRAGPGGACNEDPQQDHFRLGAPLALPQVTAVDRGEGALIARFATDGSGLQLQPGELRLADGTACRLWPDPDDPEQLRCVPLAGGGGSFLDPACTEPVVLSDSCGEPPVRWIPVNPQPPADACGRGQFDWAPLVPSSEPPDTIYVRDDEGNCNAMGIGPDLTVYVAGEARSSSSFPLVRSETR